jgi:RNA polymerase sigma-70 factor (ECF subfamily)
MYRAAMATVSDPSTLLMLRVRDGDAEAFEQLVALWQPRLVTLFMNHVGDHSTAEDLAQEVFFASVQSSPSIRAKSKVHNVGSYNRK